MSITAQELRLRHRNRIFQVPIYLGKQFRSFIYMSDWKILPMAAVIAALVSMVIRRGLFVTMEGTLTGSFALTCVAIWNGCFNSIQVICRERGTVKREHRSGMHISSYILSHMIYQAVLCLLQTIITLYVCSASGVSFPKEGFVTRWFMLDIAITVFLITYASDMVSLFFSALAHTTTAAMTIMPFILIFQLVFSGSIFTLPSWASKVSKFTISSYGLKCVAAQANYNDLQLMEGWNQLSNISNRKISGEFTVGQVLDIVSDDNGLLGELRKTPMTTLISNIKGEVIDEAVDSAAADSTAAESTAAESGSSMTFGDVLDFLINNQFVQGFRDKKITYSFTVNQLMNIIGKDKVKEVVIKETSRAMYNATYEHSLSNIYSCWIHLAAFILFFAALSVISLEFIDKDKR